MTDEFQFRPPRIMTEVLHIYNARQKPFRIHGLYRPEEPGIFKRIPLDVAERTSKNVRL